MKHPPYLISGWAQWMRFLVLISVIQALSGCAMQDSDPSNSAPVATTNNCASDSDCPVTQVCRVGLCSAPKSEASTLNFRFIPPGNSDYLPQYEEAVEVLPQERTDFVLHPALVVRSGNGNPETGEPDGIRYTDSMLGGPDGTLIFRPVDARNSLFIREAHVERGTFRTQINPGTYSLTFVPGDRGLLPKKMWEERTFTRNTILTRTLRAPADYTEVRGVLSHQIVAADSEIIPERRVPNAQVYALSSDGRFTSTITTTDESGYFKLKVEPNTGTYDLFVLPATPESLIPSIVFREAFDARDGQCSSAAALAAESCNLGNLSLGSFSPTPIQVSVELRLPERFKGEFSWKGTIVVAEGPLGNGEFEQKYSVDENGRVELLLFPGRELASPERPYTLEIIPPADGPFARMKFSISGDLRDGTLPAVELRQKHYLSGQLVAADGSSVPGATLQFQRISEPVEEAAPDADANRGDSGDNSLRDDTDDWRTFSVSTDDQGRFQVWLLSASYRVQAIPAHTSGQPRLHTILSSQTIMKREPLRFKLPEPTVISGTIFGLDSTAETEKLVGLADIGVEAYKIIEGESVILGQARSNAQGEFKMAVPWD